MKKKTLIIIFSVLLSIMVLGLILLYVFVLKEEEDQSFVHVESGEVFYKEEGGSYSEIDGKSMELSDDNYIKTGDGLAHIILPDRRMISIDRYTEIQLKIEDEDISISQKTGKTWHRLKSSKSGGDYEVESSNIVAAAEGTIFGFEVEEEDDKIIVYSIKSEVIVSGKEEDSSDKEKLGTEEMLEIEDGEFSDVEELEGLLTETEWYLRNLIIDDLFDEYDPDEIMDEIRGDKDLDNVLEENEEEEDEEEVDEADDEEDEEEEADEDEDEEDEEDEEEEFGIVKGKASYPSEALPDTLTICAENDDTLETYCTQDIDANSNYELEVPAGNYYIYAFDENAEEEYYAYYSEFVTCGLSVECESHDPIKIEVEGGGVLDGIDPGDWYYNN